MLRDMMLAYKLQNDAILVHQQPQSLLFSLPPEIRIIIWTYALTAWIHERLRIYEGYM